MMPSAYDTNKTNESKYGYYALPIVKSLSPGMYGEYENGRKGYWACRLRKAASSVVVQFGQDHIEQVTELRW